MIGENEFKSILLESGLTVKQFAENYRIPFDTVSSWSSGRSSPPKYVLNFMRRIVRYDFGPFVISLRR